MYLAGVVVVDDVVVVGCGCGHDRVHGRGRGMDVGRGYGCVNRHRVSELVCA